jgi:hypothetical protein
VDGARPLLEFWIHPLLRSVVTYCKGVTLLEFRPTQTKSSVLRLAAAHCGEHVLGGAALAHSIRCVRRACKARAVLAAKGGTCSTATPVLSPRSFWRDAGRVRGVHSACARLVGCAMLSTVVCALVGCGDRLSAERERVSNLALTTQRNLAKPVGVTLKGSKTAQTMPF